MAKLLYVECDECGCLCDDDSGLETVTILGYTFYYCFDCFRKSQHYKYYEKMVKKDKAPKVHWCLENLPINNGWDGKNSFLKISIKKEK